jgi:ribosomal protein L22
VAACLACGRFPFGIHWAFRALALHRHKTAESSQIIQNANASNYCLHRLLCFRVFQLLRRRSVGQAKSVLPPTMEAKRISIATKHNQIVGVMVLFLIVALFSGPRPIAQLASKMDILNK